MFVYRNNNTSDVVQYEHRSARLDMLPNWELLSEPEPSGATEEPSAQGDAPQEKPNEPSDGGGDSGSGSDDVQRPARSASKADWQAYARARTQDSDEEAAIDGLTKDQLIEQYGGES
ncbi:hypothetical protein ACQEVY_23495 [Streptomyces sp. CA-288835]|uniref:hypothetical protein n=1 Tax=Streptomyces sp. CA-288835 TaxID=3240069 RepID=UPI003D8DAE3D